MPTIRTTQVSIQSPHAASGDAAPCAWSKPAQKAVTNILSRYPKDRSRSATIPLLHLAQREFGGWLSIPAMQLVADTLNLPYMRVYEVASFYTMFNLHPVGQYHVQVCTNCACMVRGSDEIVKAVKDHTGITQLDDHHQGHSSCGTFTLTEVECLGACVDAPMMQITATNGSSHYYTKLDAKQTKQILKDLKSKGVSPLAETTPAPIDPITGGDYAS